MMSADDVDRLRRNNSETTRMMARARAISIATDHTQHGGDTKRIIENAKLIEKYLVGDEI